MLTAVGLVVALIALRPLWLPLAYWPLTVAAPKRPADVVLFEQARGFELEVARRLARPNQRPILILGKPPRLQRMGLEPMTEFEVAAKLSAQGIGEEEWEIFRSDALSQTELLRAAGAFLREEEIEAADLLVSEAEGRRWRALLAHASADAQRRIRIFPLPNIEFIGSRWWQSREGVKSVVLGYPQMQHAIFYGDPPSPYGDYDWDAYEQTLRQNPPAARATDVSPTRAGPPP